MKSANSPHATMTSRFATTIEDLEVVLNLRRAFFRNKPVSPDSSYIDCWAKNPHTMKVVYYKDEPIGYWSLIPIAEDVYQSFLLGTGSHEEMLAKHCIPWSDVKRTEAYLYIVGAVVPFEFDAANRRSDLLSSSISGGLLIDWCLFIASLFKRITIKGICGYPSREHGYKLFKTFGFEKSKVLIEQDENQPIFSLAEGQMDHFRRSLTRFAELSGRRVPIWDAEDKRMFFDKYGI